MLILRKIILHIVLFSSIQLSYATNYYLNDGSTAGDVYTTTTGVDNAVRLGTASDPYLTLQFLLTVYTLTGGDTVFFDVGTHPRATVLGGSGSAGSPIVLYGAGQGVTFVNNTSVPADVFSLEGPDYINIENMTITSFHNSDAVSALSTSSNITVQNCELIHNDAGGTAGGVQFSGSGCSVISCTITTLGFGIDLIPAPAATDNHIVYNNTINCNGTGNVAEACGIKYLSSSNNLINSNRIMGVSGTNAGIWARGGSGTLVKNNYISGFDYGVRGDGATNEMIYNNSIYVPVSALWINLNGWDIRNNILYSTAGSGFVLDASAGMPSTADYNVYYSPNGADTWNGGGSYATVVALQGGSAFEANGLEGDPLYASPATGDLSIPSGSPAEDVASILGSITLDIDGTPRSLTAREIGAYEIVTLGWTQDSISDPVTEDEPDKGYWLYQSNGDWFIKIAPEDLEDYFNMQLDVYTIEGKIVSTLQIGKADTHHDIKIPLGAFSKQMFVVVVRGNTFTGAHRIVSLK